MLLYILLIILVVYLVFLAIIKIKLKFWSKQPVFHLHNLLYWANPPGIIQHSLPEKNRYVNFTDIEFMKFDNMISKHLNKFVKLIQDNYLPQKENKYYPDIQNIIPYFTNHDQPCYCSLMFNDKITEKKELIGAITGRPLSVSLYNNKFTSYYIDYLCVDKTKRKQGVAPQLIQTHEYNQRRQNKSVSTCLFKREGNLTLIVPLVIYNTYGFKIHDWKIQRSLHPSIKLIKITRGNFHLLSNLLNSTSKSFDCFMSNTPSNILDLIDTNNYIVYALQQNQDLISAYFFRNSCMKYDEDKAAECFCCINNSKNLQVYITGFSLASKKLQQKYKIILFENIGHSSQIIENILIKHTPLFVNKSAYYFYNFAIRPLSEKKVCIIN
jgi:hypothetical protein